MSASYTNGELKICVENPLNLIIMKLVNAFLLLNVWRSLYLVLISRGPIVQVIFQHFCDIGFNVIL